MDLTYDAAVDAALDRLVRAGPPSAYSVSCNNRRDLEREDAIRMQVDAIARDYLRELRIHLAWLARRLRRDLGL